MLYNLSPTNISASTGKSSVKPLATAGTSVLLAPADPTRVGLSLLNTGNKAVVIGLTSAVTTTTGLTTIAAGQGYDFPCAFVGEVYGVSGSANQSITAVEFN